jgi:hypothetical protein
MRMFDTHLKGFFWYVILQELGFIQLKACSGFQRPSFEVTIESLYTPPTQHTGLYS